MLCCDGCIIGDEREVAAGLLWIFAIIELAEEEGLIVHT